jgi:hypothetical protein
MEGFLAPMLCVGVYISSLLIYVHYLGIYIPIETMGTREQVK